jgi:hypothetical protein
VYLACEQKLEVKEQRAREKKRHDMEAHREEEFHLQTLSSRRSLFCGPDPTLDMDIIVPVAYAKHIK